MGKKGKANRNAKIAWALGIVLVLVVGFGAMMSVGSNKLGGDSDITVTATGDCNTAPTLSTSVKDAENQATAVTTGVKYRVNDEYFSSAPSFAQGDKVQLILNASSYIDVLTEELVMQCGANKVSANIYDYTAPTMEILEDSTSLTDTAVGGASNGSAVASGGSETFTVRFTGHDKDSTGDFVYVIELGDTSNVSKVTMYDPNNGNKELAKVDVPSFYSNTLGSPYKVAFKVPAILGAVQKDYKVTAVAKSGKTITGAVYTTAYVGEPLVEDDGTFVPFGVEQEDGDTAYEATFDYDIFLA